MLRTSGLPALPHLLLKFVCDYLLNAYICPINNRMIMIKRIFIFIVALAAAVSCLNDSVYTESFTLDTSFEYDVVYGWDYKEVFGEDSLYFDDERSKLGFAWDFLAFYHKVEGTDFKGGFMLSYLAKPKDGKTEGLENKFRVNAESGFTGKTYTVFCQTDDMPESDIMFTMEEYGTCVMNFCFVNNTVEVTDSIKANFQLGDKMTLKAVGYLDDVETGSAEFTLAEYTAQKDSIVSTWTQFDLSKLGSVDKVELEVMSTRENVPTNVCIDDVVSNVSVSY